nr:hypothetical protein CFP56_21712 [Quercus suber]
MSRRVSSSLRETQIIVLGRCRLRELSSDVAVIYAGRSLVNDGAMRSADIHQGPIAVRKTGFKDFVHRCEWWTTRPGH